MSWLNSLKAAVLVDPGPGVAPAAPAPAAVAAPAAAPKGPVPAATFAAPANNEFVEAIKKGVYARNTAYTQLLAAADKLASIIADPTTRLKAAYATAGEGRAPMQIAAAVDIHLSDVDGEEARFKAAMEQKASREIGGANQQAEQCKGRIVAFEAEIVSMTQRITDLQNAILQARNDHDAAVTSAVEAQRAIDAAAGEFKVAAAAVRAELTASKAAITSTLG